MYPLYIVLGFMAIAVIFCLIVWKSFKAAIISALVVGAVASLASILVFGLYGLIFLPSTSKTEEVDRQDLLPIPLRADGAYLVAGEKKWGDEKLAIYQFKGDRKAGSSTESVDEIENERYLTYEITTDTPHVSVYKSGRCFETPENWNVFMEKCHICGAETWVFYVPKDKIKL